MDQVSRPMLIALLATVVFAAGWMAFLRPGAVESTTEQVTAPAQVATQAADAAAATEKAAGATEAAADAATGESAAATPAPAEAAAKADAKAEKVTPPVPPAEEKAQAKADAKADPQAELLREMDAGKVVVALFWDPKGADDRAARDAVKDLRLRDGKVAVHLVRVKDVGRYDSVTQGVSVTQSPTTLVISPDGGARALPGLTDPTEVDQLVREALRKK